MAARSTRNLLRCRVKSFKTQLEKCYKYPKEMEELAEGRSKVVDSVVPLIVSYLAEGCRLADSIFKAL